MKLSPAARPALAKLIRLLGSPVAGEVLASVAAMRRVLASGGSDLHDLAQDIEAPPTAPSDGRAENEFHNHFGGDDDDWEAMVAACADRPDRSTPKEWQFIELMQDWYGEPTERQMDWLVALHKRVRRAAS